MGISTDGRGLLVRLIAADGRIAETWTPSYDALRAWVAELDPSGRHDLITDTYEVATPAYFSRCLKDFEAAQRAQSRQQTRTPASAPQPVVLRMRLPTGPKLKIDPPQEPGADLWAHTAALGKAAEEPAVIRPVDEWKPVEIQRYVTNPSPAPLYHAHTGTAAWQGGSATPSVQSLTMMSQSQQSIHREIPSMHGLPPETSVEERPRSPSTPGAGNARFIQEEWNYDVVARGEELLESLVAGNFSRVDALLNGNWDVSVRHASTGDTVLHLVAKLAMSPLGLRILEHGSDVEARNAARETPLLLAVRHQRCYQLASSLLKRQADPNAVAEDGSTPLLRAAESAGEDPSRLVELLLSFRANPDYRNPEGSSALHMCTVQGDARTAAVLLAAGANPKLPVGNGWVTPLYLATTRGHADVVEVLSDFGASAP
jgi:hypothetical protein